MPLFKKKVVSNETPLAMSDMKKYIDPDTIVNHNRLSTQFISPPKQNFRQQCCSKENLKEQALLIATVASVVIGIVVGIALRGLKCPTGKKKLKFIVCLSFDYR